VSPPAVVIGFWVMNGAIESDIFFSSGVFSGGRRKSVSSPESPGRCWPETSNVHALDFQRDLYLGTINSLGSGLEKYFFSQGLSIQRRRPVFLEPPIPGLL